MLIMGATVTDPILFYSSKAAAARALGEPIKELNEACELKKPLVLSDEDTAQLLAERNLPLRQPALLDGTGLTWEQVARLPSVAGGARRPPLARHTATTSAQVPCS